METFLSAETESKAASKWFELQKKFSLVLLELKEKNYGEDLICIGIISILLPDEYFEDGAYKERRYYNKKRKAADIRLRINHKEFVKANKEKRKRMYIDHILDSIRAAGEKAGTGFDLERLLLDVERILSEQ